MWSCTMRLVANYSSLSSSSEMHWHDESCVRFGASGWCSSPGEKKIRILTLFI